jgi:hypothetical protein
MRHRARRDASIGLPDTLPPTTTRPRDHVQAIRTQSLAEIGSTGRAALAWTWALTGTSPSPVTLSLPLGRPPTRDEIQAEAAAEPERPAALTGIPTDYVDQIGDARRVLTWLTGTSDDIPLDDDQRGRFIGARDDYARTDTDIHHVLDHANRSLATFDLPEPMDPAEAADPWRWQPSWMNAAWHRGVHDLLSWVLGDRAHGPLCGRVVGLPTIYDLTYEETAAEDIIAQARPVGIPADPRRYPPPQYGEAIQATISWLRGESTAPPADSDGETPYRPK